jgi:hypothetical protein
VALLGGLLLSALYPAAAAAADPPSVSAFTVTGSPSRTGALTFSLTFSTDVSGLEAADLALAADGLAATGCAIGAPTGGPAAYSIAVSGCSEGTVQLLLAANSVTLAAHPTVTGPPEASPSQVATVDKTAPAVQSFTVNTPTPVSGTSIEYSLQFSEPVSGLTAASFRVFPESSQPWSVGSVSGSDAAYTVTLTGSTATSGTVTLRLRKDAVSDVAGNLGPSAYREAPSVAYTGSVASATIDINGSATSTSDPTLKLALATSGRAGSIKRYELQRRKGTAAWTSVSLPSPTATSVNVAVEPGANYRFRLRAVDSGDNVGDWATTVAAKVSLAQENAASVSYTGAWTRVSLSGASGGSVSHAAAAGRIARLAFSGTSVAYVSTRAPGRGIAEVWLDGQKVETIDLYAASVQKARVTWAATVAAGTHTLEIRVTGTKRPAASGTRVDVDAFLVHP